MLRSLRGVQLLQAAQLKRQILEDEVLVRSVSKSCPSCGAAISKDGGCNKVHCVWCSMSMCWSCEQLITGYDHYKPASGRCLLFNQDQVLAWEVEWNQMVAAEEAMGVGDGGLHRLAPRQPLEGGLRCRRCGRMNAKKARNNHVKCRACMTDACFVCHVKLQGPRAVRVHFGAGGCPQHS